MGQELTAHTDNLPAGAARTASQPLGTAAWQAFEPGREPEFRKGDVWLSRLPSGEAVGINDDRHVLLASGARAGKGASVIIPNLLTWPGSLVVIDPKGENAIVTARRRGGGSLYCVGLGQKVYVLDPFGAVQTNTDSFEDIKACFNPLDILNESRERSVEDATRIAEAFVIQESGQDEYWSNSAQYAIKMLILHLVSSPDFLPKEKHLGRLRRLLVAGDDEVRHLIELNASDNGKATTPSGMKILFEGMTRNPAFGGIVADAGRRYANLLETSPRTLASTFETACTHTDFIDSPAMRRCLSKSDFSLAELKGDPKGVSLYLSLPQSQMGSHARWLRMMAALVVTEAERSHAQPASGHPTLMVLDEFPGLRRMRVLEDAAAQLAGYGVKMMFVSQTLAQLKEIYKDNWETFVTNSSVKLFFGNDDHFTREYASKLSGDTEVVRSNASQNRTEGFSTGISRSLSSSTSTSHGVSYTPQGATSTSTTTTSLNRVTTTSETESHSSSRGWTDVHHKRALIAPEEIGRLFGDRAQPAALALISGMQPLALRRVWYFREPWLEGCYDPHPAHTPPLTLAELEAKRRADQEEAARRMEEERLAREAALEAKRRFEEERLAREAAEAEAARRAKEARSRSNVRFAHNVALAIYTGLSIGFHWGQFLWVALPVCVCTALAILTQEIVWRLRGGPARF